ncbi:MAG: transglutaminase-like domain-containing protein, partial [Pirellulales bacterium]
DAPGRPGDTALDASDSSRPFSIELADPQTRTMEIGIRVTADRGPVHSLIAVTPVPIPWPEQKVEVLEQSVSPGAEARLRTVDGAAGQLRLAVRALRAGQSAEAVYRFKITRYRQQFRGPAERLVVPERMPREVRRYLTPSPGIESRHASIRRLASDLARREETAWQRARRMHQWMYENVEYTDGAFKGALRAKVDGTGDCEERAALFIALCRASGIPARTVWVPGHCYAEFYLQDDQERSHWIPAQSAGPPWFGEMNDARPILQKGDRFRTPERPGELLRYVHNWLRASGPVDAEFILREVDAHARQTGG